MSKPRLVNLLDDFAFGGVSKGLGIFDCSPVKAVARPSVVAINGRAIIAPRLDAEVIVTHFPPNWRRLAFLASLKLRNPKSKIVHVEHSYTRNWEAGNVRQRARFRKMLKLAVHLIDQVVCVSNGQADWLAEATGLPRTQIEVIYPYSANPGLAALTAPEVVNEANLRIGTYGRFHHAKGFDTLIEAWKTGILPGSELLIGGFGADEERLRAIAGDTPGVRFVGRIDDVAGFLAQCDVVAVPSRWEAYGQVANEAREAGRPILVAPVDGLPEQVGAAGLVVDFTDRNAIAAAFASLDSTRLAGMSTAGREATRDCGLKRQQQWADLIGRLCLPGQSPKQRHAQA